MGHEAESDAANSRGVVAPDVLGGSLRPKQGDPAVAPATGRESVEHRAMIETVSLGVHDHRPIETEMVVQVAQRCLRPLIRREAPIVRQREAAERAIDMAMGITGA